ncbi:unnamed protein product, partial [Polarella glacialis]
MPLQGTPSPLSPDDEKFGKANNEEMLRANLQKQASFTLRFWCDECKTAPFDSTNNCFAFSKQDTHASSCKLRKEFKLLCRTDDMRMAFFQIGAHETREAA